MDSINETELIMSEILTGVSGIDLTKYVKCTFVLIGILLAILVISLIMNNINQG